MKILTLLIIYISFLLSHNFDDKNLENFFMKNDIFVGKYDTYSYDEIEAYGEYIEINYPEEKLEFREYRDYLNYTEFRPPIYIDINIENPKIVIVENGKEFKQGTHLSKGSYTLQISNDRFSSKLFYIEFRGKPIKINFFTGRFLNIGDEFYRFRDIVEDRKRTLFWLDKPSSKVSYKEAENFCEKIQERGGFDGWRVPEIKELWYIANRYKSPPSLQPQFINIKSENSYSHFYWSSTKVKNFEYESSNFGINFFDGYDVIKDIEEMGSVMCVSGELGFGRVELERDDEKNVVIDSTNRVWWTDEREEKYLKWKDAEEYCKTLFFAGVSNWRMPSVEELYSIVDHQRDDKPFVNRRFLWISPTWYWSSTKVISKPQNVFSVNFYYGSDNLSYRENRNRVICIRNMEK